MAGSSSETSWKSSIESFVTIPFDVVFFLLRVQANAAAADGLSVEGRSERRRLWANLNGKVFLNDVVSLTNPFCWTCPERERPWSSYVGRLDEVVEGAWLLRQRRVTQPE